MKVPANLPKDLDSDLWRVTGFRGEASGSLYKGVESHVLLAACAANETAMEDGSPKRGLFTSALIALLRKDGVDKLTYADVLKRMETIPKCVFSFPRDPIDSHP